MFIYYIANELWLSLKFSFSSLFLVPHFGVGIGFVAFFHLLVDLILMTIIYIKEHFCNKI